MLQSRFSLETYLLNEVMKLNILRRLCLNPKLVASLIAIAVAVFVFAPDLASRVIPLLILAACPLSMLFMGTTMMRGHQRSGHTEGQQESPTDEVASPRAEVSALRTQIESARGERRGQ